MARNNNQGNSFNPATYKKRSGAKYIAQNRNGKNTVTGWNVSRERGFISLVASPVSEDGIKAMQKQFGNKEIEFETASQSGQVYERWVASIEFRRNGETKTMSAFFDRHNMKLYIPKLNLVASCRAANGGYFGKARA